MICLLYLMLGHNYALRSDPSSEQLADRVRVLVAGMTATDFQQRARVEQQILVLGPRAVEPLLAILKSADPIQAEAIDRLLPRFGPDAIPTLAVAPARTGPYKQEVAREAALEAVSRMGKSAFPEIRKLLDNEHDGPRGFGIGALRRMGELANDELIAMLKHPRCDVRSSAALILASLPGARSTEAFLEVLSSGDECVQAESARALAVRGDRRAVEPLLKLLKSPDPTLRGAAAGALGKLYEPRFLVPLIGLARSDIEVTVRNTAANALISQRGDSVAIRLGRRYRPATLQPLFEDPQWLVFMLRLLVVGFLVYWILWAGARWSRAWLSWPIWLSVICVAAVGFYWGFGVLAITPTVERWLLLIAIPASAGLVFATGPHLKVLLIPLAGFALSIVLTVLSAVTGMLGWVLLSWLAPRLLIAILVATGVAAVVQMFRVSGERRVLWRFRVSALLGLATFYAGYWIGWRSLWGGEPPSVL